MNFFIASSAHTFFMSHFVLVFSFTDFLAPEMNSRCTTHIHVRVFRAFPFYYFRLNFVLSNIAHSYVSVYLFYLCCKYVCVTVKYLLGFVTCVSIS